MKTLSTKSSSDCIKGGKKQAVTYKAYGVVTHRDNYYFDNCTNLVTTVTGAYSVVIVQLLNLPSRETVSLS